MVGALKLLPLVFLLALTPQPHYSQGFPQTAGGGDDKDKDPSPDYRLYGVAAVLFTIAGIVVYKAFSGAPAAPAVLVDTSLLAESRLVAQPSADTVFLNYFGSEGVTEAARLTSVAKYKALLADQAVVAEGEAAAPLSPSVAVCPDVCGESLAVEVDQGAALAPELGADILGEAAVALQAERVAAEAAITVEAEAVGIGIGGAEAAGALECLFRVLIGLLSLLG